MKIRLTYLLDVRDLPRFPHLSGPDMSVVIDTGLLDDEEDLKARIVDEVLRTYGICITSFDEKMVPSWSRIRHTVLCAIAERKYCEANERAGHFREMLEETMKSMAAIAARAEAEARARKKEWDDTLEES